MSEKVIDARKISLPEIYNKLLSIEGQFGNMLQRILMQQELLTHMEVLKSKTLLDTIHVPTSKETEYHTELTEIKKRIKAITTAVISDGDKIQQIINTLNELSKKPVAKEDTNDERTE